MTVPLDLAGDLERTLATRLRQARETAGLTQGWVAQQIGVTAAAVTGWERGTRHPRLDHMLTWAAMFGIRIGIVEQEGPPTP